MPVAVVVTVIGAITVAVGTVAIPVISRAAAVVNRAAVATIVVAVLVGPNRGPGQGTERTADGGTFQRAAALVSDDRAQRAAPESPDDGSIAFVWPGIRADTR